MPVLRLMLFSGLFFLLVTPRLALSQVAPEQGARVQCWRCWHAVDKVGCCVCSLDVITSCVCARELEAVLARVLSLQLRWYTPMLMALADHTCQYWWSE